MHNAMDIILVHLGDMFVSNSILLRRFGLRSFSYKSKGFSIFSYTAFFSKESCLLREEKN